MDRHIHPAYGPLTGLRDQGHTLHEHPRDMPPPDQFGLGTRQEQAKNKADEARMALKPPHVAVTASHLA